MLVKEGKHQCNGKNCQDSRSFTKRLGACIQKSYVAFANVLLFCSFWVNFLTEGQKSYTLIFCKLTLVVRLLSAGTHITILMVYRQKETGTGVWTRLSSLNCSHHHYHDHHPHHVHHDDIQADRDGNGRLDQAEFTKLWMALKQEGPVSEPFSETLLLLFSERQKFVPKKCNIGSSRRCPDYDHPLQPTNQCTMWL